MTIPDEAVEAACASYRNCDMGQRWTLESAMSAALEAAAPYMLPAPEGVSEAEKRLAGILSNPTFEGQPIPVSVDDAAALLSALSSERERAERLQREINEALMLTEAASSLKDMAAGFIEGAHAAARAQAAEAKVKELLGLLAPFVPIKSRDTPDYAVLSFGDHRTQAMTMQPNDWIALSDAALRWTEEASQGGRGSDASS